MNFEMILTILFIVMPGGLVLWLIFVIARDIKERKRKTKMIKPRIKGKRY